MLEQRRRRINVFRVNVSYSLTQRKTQPPIKNNEMLGIAAGIKKSEQKVWSHFYLNVLPSEHNTLT